MAELLLGALLPVLYEQLSSHALIKFANREKVCDLVKKWETKLRYISALLEDAEEKAMRGDVKVQPWLEDLRDLVYDIGNIVDEFVTEEGIHILAKQAADRSSTSKVRSLVTSLKPGFMSDKKLRSRMKKIDDRLNFILEQKINLGLTETSGSTKNTSHSNYHRMTDSLPQYNVIGRQKDESTILAELLTETDNQHLSVIPIVGLGGVGKTTLVQSVFNNPAVIEAFPKRGWACVSDNFNMVDIARSLLRSLGGSVDTTDDLNFLHNKLRGILSKEKFLIVLDDYWNVDYNNWERLYNLYSIGVDGSKVIVTTRNLDVASMMTNRQTVSLRELSRDDCLSLLAYHALGVENFDAHSHLKLIGEEIAAKCKGLPLAAKTLGGLLRSKSDTREWEEIRDSKIWNLPQGKDDILLALKLSYIHLPPHLKRCFVFCAIFPEDYEFDRDELVLLWMADGLVELKRKNARSSMLDQGRKQFDELQSMSFFQRSTQNESMFVMHDLMRDLATSIAGNTCLNVESIEIEDVKYKSPEKIRHLLYSSISWELDANFEKCHVLKGLRTFIASHKRYLGSLSDNALEEFLQNLKYLRVLSLRHYHFIAKIPNCIGHLKHLRYLKIYENSSLKELPESICTLYNLETLILNGCSGLTELPRGMDKLINLKCLDISDTPKLKKMPVELGHMHKLEILSKFIVGREDEGLRLKALRHWHYLQGELFIYDLQNVEDVGDARDAGLNGKVGLTTLALIWYEMSNDFGSCFYRNVDKERMVFEFLQPHPKVKVACIYGYGGISFPLWIGSPSFANMTKVQLGFCGKVTALPSFGLLPSLRELEIERMDAVRTVGSEFYGNAERPFPCLEVLKFVGMTAWEVWASTSCGDIENEEPFPRLIHLELKKCPSLVSNLPHRLCSLVELSIYECPLLKASPCMADLSSLKDLKLEGCNNDLLAIVSSASRNSFKMICLESIQKLTYLNKDTLSTAERLEIDSCNELIGLWEDNVSKSVVASITRLKYLSIKFCANLQKLPNNMRRLSSLRELTIHRCSKLQSLPKKIMSCNLEKLYIYQCQSLEVAKVPSTLISLKIHSCEKMKRLSNGTSVINNNDSSSRNNAVHLQLEELDIQDSSIRNIPSFLSMLTKLTKLELSDCPFLKMDVFSELPSCLRSLKLHKCKKIKALPHQIHTKLTSLQSLVLWELNIESFPEGGLPLSIEELTVGECPRFKQRLEEWGLHRLTTLKSLTIAGEIGSLWLQQEGMLTSFPHVAADWILFPSNLESLQIEYQPDMVRLSNGLRDHLTSLRWLQFFSCPKLQFLPKEGFPPSLEHLDIEGCSEDLVSNCSKNGDYFPLICSIMDFIV